MRRVVLGAVGLLYTREMYARSRAPALVLGLAVVTSPVVAWTDVFPPEELDGVQIGVSIEITGLSRFPDHVFYAYPVYCTRGLAAIYELQLMWDDEDDGGRPNYIELRDGPVASWLGADSECPGSVLYALARDIAAGIDLAAMSPTALDEFFTGDPRLFHARFEFVDRPLYATKGSPLQDVHEVVRVLNIDSYEITAVVDAATYRFADGTEQTLKLGHTKRPPLPFRALKPEKVAKYAMVNAKWEVKQPVEPAKAPRLPDGASQEAATDGAESGTAEGTGTGAAEVGASGGEVVASGAGEVAAVEAPVVAVVETTAAVPVEPVRGPPVVETAVAAEATRPVLEAAVEEELVSEAAPELDPLSSRLWPLGALLVGVVVVIGGVGLARRRGV